MGTIQLSKSLNPPPQTDERVRVCGQGRPGLDLRTDEDERQLVHRDLAIGRHAVEHRARPGGNSQIKSHPPRSSFGDGLGAGGGACNAANSANTKREATQRLLLGTYEPFPR